MCGLALAAIGFGAAEARGHDAKASSRRVANYYVLPPAAIPATTPSGVVTAADRDFLKSAAERDVAEMQIAKLAEQKSQDPEVKRFAREALDDNARADAKLRRLAEGKRVGVPAKVNARDQRGYKQLEKLSGARFDREALSRMANQYRRAVSAFVIEGAFTTDPDIRSFVDEMLAALEENEQIARRDRTAGELEASIGAAGSVRSG